MSSSKIQARNIDTGADIAKESTSQEILSSLQETSMNVVGLMNVDSTVTCTASDNILLTLISSEISTIDVNASAITIGTIKSNKVSGTVRLIVSAKSTDCGFSIDDGSFTDYITVTSENSSQYKTYSIEKQIVDGGTYTFRLSTDSIGGNGYINMATICGDFSEPATPVPNISVVK